MRVQLYRGRFYAVWREGGQTKRRALRADNRADAERALADHLKKPKTKPAKKRQRVRKRIQKARL